MGVHRLTGFMTLAGDERKKTIQQFLKTNRTPASSVYLSLPRDQGIVRQIQLPAETKRKLPEIVKLQVETLSPWPASEIYWDFAAEPLKKDQRLMTVTIVIIPRSHVDPWIAFFKSVGLPLSGATLSSLAQGHAIHALWKEPAPTIVVHREDSYTEGTFVSGSRLVALTVASSEKDAGGIAPTVLADRLLSAAKVSSSEGSRLILCGDIDVAAFQDNPPLPIDDAKPESAKDLGAIAAALLPLKETAFNSNLVPAEVRYHESRRRLIPAFGLGLLAIFMGVALLLREPYQSSVYASQLDGEIRRVSPKVKEVADQEKELDRLLQRYRALTSQMQNRDYVLETLGELARILPASTFLTSYSYQDGTVTVSGLAPSASEVQKLLESSPVFKGVEFTNSVTREPSGNDRFTLKMVLEVPR